MVEECGKFTSDNIKTPKGTKTIIVGVYLGVFWIIKKKKRKIRYFE